MENFKEQYRILKIVGQKKNNKSLVYGYARVSTRTQFKSLKTQHDELVNYGCNIICVEYGSARGYDYRSRSGLVHVLHEMKKDNIIAFTKLDRLTRSSRALHEIIGFLIEKKMGFSSIAEGLICNNSLGRFVMSMLAALAEWEGDNIRQRVRDGVLRAKERGAIFGRGALFTKKQVEDIKDRRAENPRLSIRALARAFCCSPATIVRALKGTIVVKNEPVAPIKDKDVKETIVVKEEPVAPIKDKEALDTVPKPVHQ